MNNTRDVRSMNNKLLNTFDVMRISKKQKVVGSAGVIGNIITNDYDLNEIFDKNATNDIDILSKLYFMFLWKFKTIYETLTLWITDFKCGEYKNEPIRWTLEDMENGYKNFGDERIDFTKCLTQFGTKTKLDVVLLLNDRFVEISELYYIKVNGISNFDTDDFRLGTIINDLRDDMEKLYIEKNYFKALKREYRILTLLDKEPRRREVLTDLFNGKFGYLYYAISQLKTLIIMKEQTFREVPSDIFLSVQQNIKDDIGKLVNYPYSITQLNRSISVKSINIIINYLTEYLNFRIQKYF